MTRLRAPSRLRFRPWPRSLAGQMALLVALALFVAQAINFALIVRDRSTYVLAAATRPAAIRIADALDREAAGRPIAEDRGRVRRLATSPITAAMTPRPDIAHELVRQLAEFDIHPEQVQAAIATQAQVPAELAPREPAIVARHRPRRDARDGQALLIAVRQHGDDWLVQRIQWVSVDGRILWRLLGQTLILYGVILLPVLWIARRISRPLRALTAAAHNYDPATPPAPPIEHTGPQDVRALIAAFDALRLRVAAMLDEKDRMLGAIGHDLRTPLAALRVRIESVEDDQDRARMADTIDEMTRTLEDILSLARLGRPSEPVGAVDVTALVDAVVEDFRDLGEPVSLADAPRITLSLRAALMRRAVRNLIENAVKYAGAAEVSVEQGVGAQGIGAVTITVADRGPGIPPDRMAAVFDPFTRLETSRNRDTGGIGLGLALARAIVQEAGGTITLANRDGGGLLATITLPGG